jgi:oxepin-CoA hydrolase/3-oxo-5,6-dehydrosuberyl-CoA semialdehyde dehydrogenase
MALPILSSWLCDSWTSGSGPAQTLLNPSTETPIAQVMGGFDEARALAFARDRGGPALSALTFAERGALLRAMSRLIHEHRDELIGLALDNGGNTRGDAKFDIDGASATLAAYADLGEKLGSTTVLVDGEATPLGRSPRLVGAHFAQAKAGVAVHINAFNFPAWGLAEKAACALLAGMPVITKPATATAHVAHRIVELVAAQKLLPPGAFQLVLGPTGTLLDRLDGQDVLAFTGSGATGQALRKNPRLVAENVRVNVEADSLNAAVLGPDVEPGSDTWNAFVNEVTKDITQKTGQKCTAIRRILIAEDRLADAKAALVERLAATKVGAPREADVTMGPVATAQQLRDVIAGAKRLAGEAKPVLGSGERIDGAGAPAGKGYFIAPLLFEHNDPASGQLVHELEVFGPVSTILAYDGSAKAAAELVRRGGGSLVSSVWSDDRGFLGEAVRRMATHLGRVYLASAKVAGQTMGPGTVLPSLVHGGPGRAGGGEELGGVRGLAFYMQRTAISGDKALIDAILAAR